MAAKTNRLPFALLSLYFLLLLAVMPSDAFSEPSQSCSGLSNSAFVFIKPHANTPATQALVKERLTKAGIDIKFEGEIEGEKIDEKKLIDQVREI